MRFQTRLLTALVAAIGFLVPSASFAAVASGSLVKLPDDGNPNTTIDSAVYYVAGDGKRYAFPNAQTYFSWYADFSSVKSIAASELAGLSLGGNVTYRPGTRLVKITSDPNVYAVEPGGVLRHITSEAVAVALYGANWSKRVDDVPDVYFLNYKIGDPLAAPVYPSGTVVKRSSDGAYFLIESGTKRRISGADVLAALRVQGAFVIETGTALDTYPDAAVVASAEPAITDTAQKAIVTIPSSPTISVRLPSTNYFPVGGEAQLIEVRVASSTAVRLRRIAFRVDATTNVTKAAATDTDDDKGGLVYENNARTNFRDVRVRDANGGEPFGRQEFVLSVALDQSQTLTFSGDSLVPAGTERAFALVANVNALLPNAEGYKVTVLAADTQLVDDAGQPAAWKPGTDLVGATLTSLNSSLEVKPYSGTFQKTHVRGALNAEISALSFKATTVAPNVIKSLALQAYVDEESAAGFLPGGDSDNGSKTLAYHLLPSVSLYDMVTGAKVAGPSPLDADGKVQFTGMEYVIPAGATGTLVVRGDIPNTVELEQKPDRVAFDFRQPADATVTDEKGNKVSVLGELPNGGTSPASYVTIKPEGLMTFGFAGASGNAVAGREVLLGTLTVEAKDDSYDLRAVSFVQGGTETLPLGDARLSWAGTDGKTVSVTTPFLGGNIQFSALPITVESGKSLVLSLHAKVGPRDSGTKPGTLIPVRFQENGGFEYVSRSTKKGNAGHTVSKNVLSVLTTRYTLLTVTQDVGSPSGSVYRATDTEVLWFTIKAEPEGQARIKKLSFNLRPGDVGSGDAGFEQDALEYWSKLNGDFEDDDYVISLVRYQGTSRTVLGEGSGASIDYGIVRSGAKSKVSSTLTSKSGDYGNVTITFDEGNELAIGPGGIFTFRLEVNTTGFNPQKEHSFSVDMAGAHDFLWTDVPSGAYTALSGVDIGMAGPAGVLTVRR